jgi:hypothetical protein
MTLSVVAQKLHSGLLGNTIKGIKNLHNRERSAAF